MQSTQKQLVPMQVPSNLSVLLQQPHSGITAQLLKHLLCLPSQRQLKHSRSPGEQRQNSVPKYALHTTKSSQSNQGFTKYMVLQGEGKKKPTTLISQHYPKKPPKSKQNTHQTLRKKIPRPLKLLLHHRKHFAQYKHHWV